MFEIMILLIGMFSGALGTLLGLGGGGFAIPLLVFILHMDIHQAISLSLISVVAKSIFSTALSFKKNFVNIPLGLLLTAPALIGSAIGGSLGLVSSELLLSILFSGAMIFSGFLVFIHRNNAHIYYNPDDFLSGSYKERNILIQYTPIKTRLAMLVSSIAGFFGGIIGIGGGGILVPIMRVVNGIPIKAAASTSTFIMGFSSMIPAFLYYQKGVLVPSHGVFIIVGMFFGAIIGNGLLSKIKEQSISKIFFIALMLTALSMIVKLFF